MSMSTAEREGLVFQGMTAESWQTERLERLKKKAAEIRKLGFRAKSVKSLQSEWGGGCHVLMVEQKWFEYEHAKQGLKLIQSAGEKARLIREKAEAEVAKLMAEVEEAKKLCDEFGLRY